jgi:hypothetical protein
VSPLEITLSPQIDRWTTNSVTITANGNRALSLSDVSVTDPRVSVAIKEITPAHLFQVVMAFPPGFKLAQGQVVQMSVKSNSPERPLVTVPIKQFFPQPGTTQTLPHPKVISQNPPPGTTFQAVGHP